MSVTTGNRMTHPEARRVVFSVIIASWNTRDLLQSLLTSIGKHVPADSVEIVVIDNGSTDGSAAMVSHDFPHVKLIANTVNAGYARANNEGFAQAVGDAILLLGSDTVIVDDSLRRMCDYLHEHPEVGAVTCRLMNPDGTPQLSCRRFPTLGDAVLTYLSLHRLARTYTIRDFDYGKTQDVEQPAATCLMVRRTLLDHIGLFDEGLTILYNDVDLCQRIHLSGKTIVYLADAAVVHFGSQSTGKATPAVRLEMYRNILMYYERHVGMRARWVLLPILLVRLLAVTRSLNAFRLLVRSTGFP